MFTQINCLPHGGIYPQKTFITSPRGNSAIFCSEFCQARFAAIVVEEKEVIGNTMQFVAQLNELTVPSF